MKLFLAISSHWDREWYKPFQGFRYDLVKMTSKLLGALENDELKVFTFDGQTVVLEDYLEIRPQDKERIAKLIKDGKLKVGPWYVMPDELLVSGESLIRNFLTGKHIAQSYGSSPWAYGYMNDIFGHIAQMPQILAGFGIKGAYLGRGVGAKDQNYTNFVWTSPDGTECFAYKGRYASLLETYTQNKEDADAAEKLLNSERDKTDCVVMLYTHDHTTIDDNAIDFQKYADGLSEKYEIIEGLEHLADYVGEYKEELPHEYGELITTGERPEDFRSVTHSISSYYPIKRENDICEDILENKISPLLAAAKLKNIDFEPGFYDTAYKYLLKNQPHDSICGCSSEVVHENMFYRYSQVHSITEAITTDYKERVECRYEGKDKFDIKVMNFSLKKFDGVFVTDIEFDKSWESKMQDNARYQTINSFLILDENGNELEYQILNIENNYIESIRPYVPNTDKYTVAVKGTLNAFGTTIFRIVPGKKKNNVRSVSDGELTAENEYIALSISNDGSVSITDKTNGKVYDGLNAFIDDGEVGNGWFAENPLSGNNVVSSKGAYSVIEVMKNGPLYKQFRVTKHMSIPKAAEYNTYRRSEERTDIKITTDIILRQGSRHVEFETVIDNNARDHRLRVEFPTGTEGNRYLASQAFTFIERGRGVTEKGANFAEPEAYEKNTSGIICVKNENCGLSFIGKEGFHEIGVSKSGVITATMLRCFGRIMFNQIANEGAQLIGKHKFRYAVSLETNLADLIETKKQMMEIFTNVKSGCDENSESLIELDGDVAVSIVKPSEDGKGIIIRLYNPTNDSKTAALKFKFEAKNAAEVDLAENVLQKSEIFNDELKMEIGPHKIKTVYVEGKGKSSDL